MEEPMRDFIKVMKALSDSNRIKMIKNYFSAVSYVYVKFRRPWAYCNPRPVNT